MRILGKIFVGLVVISIIAAAGFYWSVLRPGNQYIEANKKTFISTAKSFMDCLQGPAADFCTELVSDTFREATPLMSLRTIAEAIKTKLGKRIDSSLVEESLTWNKFVGAQGPVFTVRFRMKAFYEKDALAQESFTLVQKGESLLVEGFHVNSDQMLK